MADLPNLSRDEIDKTLRKFEKINGNKLKNFSTKEIVLMFHKDTKKDIEICNNTIMQLDKKLDKRIEWGQKTLSKHDIIIQKITDQLEHVVTELPEKGFCEKVTNELELGKEQTMNDKVDTMWHDRRWIKRLLAILITLTVALGGGNILIQCA